MGRKGKDALSGIHDGFPIFLGYFTTALAFGLLTRNSGFRFAEGVMVSLTNFAGSGQFLMMNLYNAGSFLFEIALSVFFINSRYIFMAASLSQRLRDTSFKGQELSYSYMAGLIFTSYAGWVSGTALGYVVGTFLPDVVQKAAVITVYAMFASLLGSETRKHMKALFVAAFSALSNTLLILVIGLGTGVSFLISLILATLFGAFIYTDKEAGLE